MTVVAILGGGGHAKVCLEAARAAGQNVSFVCAPNHEELSGYSGIKLYRTPDEEFIDSMASDVAFVIGVGDMSARRSLAECLAAKKRVSATIVHPRAIVAESSTLAPGVFVAAAGVINPGAKISKHAVVNTNAVVEHDCQIGAGAFVGPGAVIAGGASIGDWAFVGSGAIVLPGVNVGSATIVGAGAVVSKDVPQGKTVVGVPAEALR